MMFTGNIFCAINCEDKLTCRQWQISRGQKMTINNDLPVYLFNSICSIISSDMACCDVAATMKRVGNELLIETKV